VFRVSNLEIPVSDLERAVDAHECIFGGGAERVVVDVYNMARVPTRGDGQGAGVTLAHGDVYIPSRTGSIFCSNVANIDAMMSRAAEPGAGTPHAKKEVAPGAWVARFEGSEGNRVASSQTSEGALSSTFSGDAFT